MRERVGLRTRLGRLGLRRDIAPAAAAFLASSGSAWVSGQILDIAGGLR
jgi:NAD(P)-dependent dehydrogenase (short-subunit alcohol dehydrogenase family)